MTAVTARSKFAQGTLGVITGDCAGDLVENDFFIDLTAAQVALNNVFELGPLPAYHSVADMILIPDDLDTNGTPTVKLDVGILTGTAGDGVGDRTVGAEFFSADTSAQSGAIARMTLATGFKILATEVDRGIGVKIQTGAATAAAGRIRLRVTMKSADHKVQF